MADEKEKSRTIVTPEFRLAFPEVFVPKAAPNSTREVYSINMLFDKTADLKNLRLLLRDAIIAKWGEDQSKWPAVLGKAKLATAVGIKGWPIRDGDEVTWPGYPGNLFARASTTFQPQVIDRAKNEILDKNAIFGGLLCRAAVNAFAYDNSGNKGVSLGLSILQVLKDDGTRYGGGRPDVNKVFGDDDWADPSAGMDAGPGSDEGF